MVPCQVSIRIDIVNSEHLFITISRRTSCHRRTNECHVDQQSSTHGDAVTVLKVAAEDEKERALVDPMVYYHRLL